MIHKTFVLIAVASLLLLSPALGVSAQGDITPPVMVSIASEPSHVDTSGSNQTISVTVTITDDLSGLNHSFIIFTPEVGTTQWAEVSFEDRNRVSGTEMDGIYSATFTLPKYAAEGWWMIDQLNLRDNVGNEMIYFGSSLEELPDYLRNFRFYNGPDAALSHTVYLPVIDFGSPP